MNQTASWLLLLIIGIFLVIVGFEGALGKVVAVAFTPGLLEYQYGGGASGNFG